MDRRWGWAALGAALIATTAAPAAPGTAETVAQAMAAAYVAAWDRGDASALGAQFAADGDFINPAGVYARGPAEIGAFYRTAFARGYSGSAGAFRVVKVRRLAPGVVAIDGEWSITGARGPDGRPRPPERGIAAAVLVSGAGGWKVALLREQEGAAKIAG
ncbi:MAG TPA: SgcJ/EcaC family oxidoreductase [Phenylobacterium sp.]|uniref:YybH family protein n=1 Tax=Phenylobacterium sp. TaxID=1871053 RepID=UPI002CBC124D|nr:SgcJ/EcaC family oxidoreductase [Phenylobacterium sp.]HSV04317.1 SgcJ/EcaC family oxidoreductase [Phenylobacterium sp.]